MQTGTRTGQTHSGRTERPMIVHHGARAATTETHTQREPRGMSLELGLGLAYGMVFGTRYFGSHGKDWLHIRTQILDRA
jgi:hypothetical protein